MYCIISSYFVYRDLQSEPPKVETLTYQSVLQNELLGKSITEVPVSVCFKVQWSLSWKTETTSLLKDQNLAGSECCTCNAALLGDHLLSGQFLWLWDGLSKEGPLSIGSHMVVLMVTSLPYLYGGRVLLLFLLPYLPLPVWREGSSFLFLMVTSLPSPVKREG